MCAPGAQRRAAQRGRHLPRPAGVRGHGEEEDRGFPSYRPSRKGGAQAAAAAAAPRAAPRPPPAYLQALQPVLERLHGAAQLVDDVRGVARQVAHGVLALGQLLPPAVGAALAAAQLGRQLADGVALAADRLLLLHDGLPQLQHRGLQLLLGRRQRARPGTGGERAARVRRQRRAHEAAARVAVPAPAPAPARGGQHEPGQQGQHPGGTRTRTRARTAPTPAPGRPRALKGRAGREGGAAAGARGLAAAPADGTRRPGGGRFPLVARVVGEAGKGGGAGRAKASWRHVGARVGGRDGRHGTSQGPGGPLRLRISTLLVSRASPLPPCLHLPAARSGLPG